MFAYFACRFAHPFPTAPQDCHLPLIVSSRSPHPISQNLDCLWNILLYVLSDNSLAPLLVSKQFFLLGSSILWREVSIQPDLNSILSHPIINPNQILPYGLFVRSLDIIVPPVGDLALADIGYVLSQFKQRCPDLRQLSIHGSFGSDKLAIPSKSMQPAQLTDAGFDPATSHMDAVKEWVNILTFPRLTHLRITTPCEDPEVSVEFVCALLGKLPNLKHLEFVEAWGGGLEDLVPLEQGKRLLETVAALQLESLIFTNFRRVEPQVIVDWCTNIPSLKNLRVAKYGVTHATAAAFHKSPPSSSHFQTPVQQQQQESKLHVQLGAVWGARACYQDFIACLARHRSSITAEIRSHPEILDLENNRIDYERAPWLLPGAMGKHVQVSVVDAARVSQVNSDAFTKLSMNTGSWNLKPSSPGSHSASASRSSSYSSRIPTIKRKGSFLDYILGPSSSSPPSLTVPAPSASYNSSASSSGAFVNNPSESSWWRWSWSSGV